MGKLIAIIIMSIALVGGAAYYFSNQSSVKTNVSKLNVQTATPTPTTAPLNTSDQSIDSDLSALDKDLLELDKLDGTLTSDINSL